MSDHTDPFDPIVVWRTSPYVDPRPVLFVCAICEEEIRERMWGNSGRNREIEPICLHCETTFGGNPMSAWPGSKMDGRIARRVKAAAVFLECLVNRQKWERNYRGA